jgi:hypothetical protein
VHLPTVDIPTLKTRLTRVGCVNKDLRYLNLHGLYYFLTTILTTRKEKGLNVDKYRKRLFDQIIHKTHSNDITIEDTIIETFWILFYNTERWKDYKMKVLDKLFKNKIKSINSTFFENLEAQVNKMFAPHLDTFLSHLNTILSKYDTIGQKSCLFKVGGSAIRRYLGEQITISDIDAKLFYNATMSNNKRQELYDLVAQEIVLLGEIILKRDFSAINQRVDIDEGFFCDISSELRLRPRFLNRSTMGFDLFSLDSRIKLTFGTNVDRMEDVIYDSIGYKSSWWWDYVSDEANTYNMYFDVAILDISLIKTNYVMPDTCQKITINFNGVPYATVDFLTDDLKKTYRDVNAARTRDYSDKREKDLKRLKLLEKIVEFKSTVPAAIDEQVYINYIRDREDVLQIYNSPLLKDWNLIHQFTEGVRAAKKKMENNKYQLMFEDYKTKGVALLDKINDDNWE